MVDPHEINIPFVVFDGLWLIIELPLIFIVLILEFEIFTLDTLLIAVINVAPLLITVPPVYGCPFILFIVRFIRETFVNDAFDTFI